MKFETILKKARNKKKYTQQELGDKLHVSRKTISSWENGRSIPNINIIKEIEEILDIKLKHNPLDDSSNEITRRKSIYKTFDNNVLIANIASTILSIIDTAIPIFSLWIIIIQIVMDITLFYNFNKQAKVIIKKEKLVIIATLSICIISLTLLEIEELLMEDTNSFDLIMLFMTVIRSLIVSYGILFLLLFKKMLKI